MNLEIIIILILVIVAFWILTWFLSKKINQLQNKTADQALLQWLSSMQQSIERNNNTLTSVLNQTNKNISDSLLQSSQKIDQRLDSAVKLINDTTKELTRMNELGATMKDLQLLLQAPKLRGNLGEEILADMLAQILPKKNFSLQFAFQNGLKVDAIVKTASGMLPIDAKFPVENFAKQLKSENAQERVNFRKQFSADVRKHIKDIASKYIQPTQGTVDFAFMYIPSEAVFAEICNEQELMDLARQSRIYPVSPNTLYAHLQTVLLAFEGQKIEESAKSVLRLLKSLQKDYVKMDESVSLLGKHLQNASNQYANTFSQMNVLGQKLNRQDLLE